MSAYNTAGLYVIYTHTLIILIIDMNIWIFQLGGGVVGLEGVVGLGWF